MGAPLPHGPDSESGAKPRASAGVSVLGWLAAVVFLLWVYSDGLRTWFVADDFAWLGLIRQVHNFHDLMRALFVPAAQGTIRPWSDRGFFLLFESVFGLESLPMRICAFVTMAADIALLGWLARRITGSPLAGFLAPILWIANNALASVMSWNSAYNEALSPFFLLAGLALFIRFAETGLRKWWWWQLVVFTLGFGALEVNVVYPAIAAAWVLFLEPRDRRGKLLKTLIPLFCISIVYFAIHRAFAPLPKEGPYTVRVDWRVVFTLWTYWKLSILPGIARALGHTRLFAVATLFIVSLALVLFFVSELRKRHFAVLFFPCWFLITLGPMLVLPLHITDYYLTIPLIGLAIMGAWGLEEARVTQRVPPRLLAAAAAALYLIAMIPASRYSTHWWLLRGRPLRAMVAGVAAAQQTHPGKTIVLDGITTELYDDAIVHRPFYPFGLDPVYLTPGSEDKVHSSHGADTLRKLVMEPAVMLHALDADSVVIYSVLGDHLRNITGVYERFAPDRLPNLQPRRVEVGNPLYSWLLGPEWLRLEDGFRWMTTRATVYIGGPGSEKDRLILEGMCPLEQLKNGPVHLSVEVDGTPLATTEISEPDFRRQYSLPARLIGQPKVLVQIGVDRVFHATDGRDLGLVFGTVRMGS